MPSPRPVACLLMLALSASLHALEVRGYSQARHNRLLDFPGAPIFPQTPVINPTFTPAAGSFLGIGWPAHPTDWTRQMALVSPRHFVYATHYVLGADWQIAFLGSDGQQHLFGIESQVPVVNTLGQTTDLMLCTLTTEVAAGTGITPFRALNLPAEADYLGREMVVFGSFVRAGKTPLGRFATLVNDPGFDTTRFACFDYDHNGGAADECDYQGGDSGAPAFIMEGGEPAIIGIASGRDPPGWGVLPSHISRNYISFIPAYLPELDLLMENHGYHMKRVDPEATAVALHATSTAPLRRMKAGQVSLVLANTGSATAHNVTLQLGAAHAPASVSGQGTFCSQASATDWNCRRAGLAASAQATVTAAWNELPDSPTLQLAATRAFDGGGSETIALTLPLIESFTSWIQGAADTSEHGDPDHDGIPNLTEYAFGGSPQWNSSATSGGHPLLPQVSVSGARLSVRHLQREDAAARGISYAVEFSSGLSPGAWEGAAPSGTTVETTACSPPLPGFEQVTVSVPMDADRRFARVKVTLAE